MSRRTGGRGGRRNQVKAAASAPATDVVVDGSSNNVVDGSGNQVVP